MGWWCLIGCIQLMPSPLFLSGPGQTNLARADCAMLCYAAVFNSFWQVVLFVFSVLYSSLRLPSLFHLFVFQFCTMFVWVLVFIETLAVKAGSCCQGKKAQRNLLYATCSVPNHRKSEPLADENSGAFSSRKCQIFTSLVPGVQNWVQRCVNAGLNHHLDTNAHNPKSMLMFLLVSCVCKQQLTTYVPHIVTYMWNSIKP